MQKQGSLDEPDDALVIGNRLAGAAEREQALLGSPQLDGLSASEQERRTAWLRCQSMYELRFDASTP